MLLSEPPRSQGDLHFRLLGFPVRIHPFFWIMCVLLGIRGEPDAKTILIWIFVVLVSILVHELGHALMFRFYGMSATIVLHAFGGLAIRQSTGYVDSYGGAAPYNHQKDGPKAQILISLAGPFAGFLLAALIIGILYAANVKIPFYWNIEFGRGEFLFVKSFPLYLLVANLISVNIMWGILNLFPIYPLDGGQIAREVFQITSGARNGVRYSLILSIVTAACFIVYGLITYDQTKSLMLPIFFGYLAYVNYKTLKAYDQYTGGYGGGSTRGW